MTQRIPLVDYLSIDSDPPHLVAHHCVACGATYFDRRNGCARCGGSEFTSTSLAPTGELVSYTIVYRSAPGVSVPFISAVVALDGGGEVKATLRDIAPDPSLLSRRMPVELVLFVAGTADDGTEAIGFGFRPASSSHRTKEHSHA